MEKKFIEKRFGSIAVEKGFITVEQLVEALTIQAKENVERDEHRRLGRILLDQGFINDSQIDEVYQVLKRNLPRLDELPNVT